MNEDLISVADKALDYLGQTVLQAGFKENGHDDVAYYFKAPAAFLAAGRTAEAEIAWHLLAPYLESGGYKSANPAYAIQYPMYPWYWMARAAHGLGKSKTLQTIKKSLADFIHPSLNAATIKAPYSANTPNTLDFFMTAAMGQTHCLTVDRHENSSGSSNNNDDLSRAIAMGDTLLHFIDEQTDNTSRFYLRMNHSQSLLKKVSEPELTAFYWVDQCADNQLYFMLGMPMMHLADLYRLTGRNKYLTGAEWLLKFCFGCGEPLYKSLMAHKVARGASMLATISSGNSAAKELSLKISNRIAALQLEDGSFNAGTEMDNYDQTAELALWLREIHKELMNQSFA